MEMNKTNMVPEDELVTVAGGAGVYDGYTRGSDGNAYRTAVPTEDCCTKYICKQCGSSGYEHRAYCRTREAIRDLCKSCSYYDAISPHCGVCRANQKPTG